ncbi:MAG: methionyl-tRNA formyltransferase [Proteobacteria bacterium SG_bin7]|nr:MAG: methionyl-tRNA formyltransferase [Proteobacteria bacterium SG_bin7]
MSTIRVVFLGTPDFSEYCLESLYGDNHFEVVGVVTQPDKPAGRKMALTPSPVKKFALDRGLRVLTPENINTDEALREIESWNGEAAVVVAYGQILSQKFLNMFEEKVVNVHVSILPRWRGAAPIQRAILADDRETGVALQKVIKKLDAGDVLGVRKLVLSDDLSALDVLEKCKPLAGELLHIEFMDYLRGNLAGAAQDESLVTYAKKIEKSEGIIDWRHSSRYIFNHVRAMTMGPGSTTVLSGKRLKITKLNVKSLTGKHQPGIILEVNSKIVVVGCGEGSVELLEVQPESKGKMPVAEFLKGNPLKKGDKIG